MFVSFATSKRSFVSNTSAIALAVMALSAGSPAFASVTLKVGDKAPVFSTPQDDNTMFNLADRKSKGWTVLYFYPKAETPGCTTQACAFRDCVKLIRNQNAEVYGVSTDSPSKLAAFRKNHQLNFPLLSDEKAKVVELYGVKMPVVDIAKRWTFVIDPDLNIRWINNNVDPAKDAKDVSDQLKKLQGK
jgi:thioredoxin-dependent peroxiredoxin